MQYQGDGRSSERRAGEQMGQEWGCPACGPVVAETSPQPPAVAPLVTPSPRSAPASESFCPWLALAGSLFLSHHHLVFPSLAACV